MSSENSRAPPQPSSTDSDVVPDLSGFQFNRTDYTHRPCGATTAQAYDDGAESSRTVPPAVRWEYITDGTAQYRDAHQLTPVPVPDSYRELQATQSPTVTMWSARFGRATGIDPLLLERALRLVDGDGRLSDDVKLFQNDSSRELLAIGQHGPFIITYPQLRAARLPDDCSPPQEAYCSIGSFDIPEECPTLQSGIKRFLGLVSRFSEVAIDEYVRPQDHGHLFVTTDKRLLRASAATLLTLGSMEQSVQAVTGTYTTTVAGSDIDQKVTQSDIEHSLGDMFVDEQGRSWGTVVGYDHSWRAHNGHSPGEETRAVSTVEYVCLDISVDDDDDRVWTTTRTLTDSINVVTPTTLTVD